MGLAEWWNWFWETRDIAPIVKSNLLKLSGFGQGDLYGMITAQETGEQIGMLTMRFLYEPSTGKIIDFLRRNEMPNYYQENNCGVGIMRLTQAGREELRIDDIYQIPVSGLAARVFERTKDNYNLGARPESTNWFKIYQEKKSKEKS